MERSEKIISAMKENGFITGDHAMEFFIMNLKMKVLERLIINLNIRMKL